jgi:hypothetical protein
VATLPIDVSDAGDRITGAAASEDGATLAVRTGQSLHLFSMDRWDRPVATCETPGLEPQGEAVDFARSEGFFFLAGEAAGAAAPLVRLRCP